MPTPEKLQTVRSNPCDLSPTPAAHKQLVDVESESVEDMVRYYHPHRRKGARVRPSDPPQTGVPGSSKLLFWRGFLVLASTAPAAFRLGNYSGAAYQLR